MQFMSCTLSNRIANSLLHADCGNGKMDRWVDTL
jgi:hypothetical protein